jgi:cytochrome c
VRAGASQAIAMAAVLLGSAGVGGVLLGSAGLAGVLLGSAAALAQKGPDPSIAFNQCTVCHSVDGTNGTGPTLKGIIGRKSGTVSGFRYSRAMKSAAITWDEVSLDRYLSNTQELVPGNIMPFSGVPDADQRAALVAYLKTLR